MKKIVDYKIVSNCPGVTSIEEDVGGEIFKGWQPLGGISVIESLDGCKQCSEDYVQVYYQAMVKYSDE